MKIKIAFYIESLAGGGAEKILCDLVEHLDRAKFEVTVTAVVGTGVHVERMKSLARFCCFLEPLVADSSAWDKLRYRLLYKVIYSLPTTWVHRLFVREKYDLEVAFTEGFVTKLVAASPDARSAKIAWVHIDLVKNHWTRRVFSSLAAETRAYARFDRVLCVSKVVKESVQKLFGVADKAEVRHNPVDTQAILRKSLEGGAPVSRPAGLPLRLVTIGRLEHQKGYDRLLPIHGRLLSEGVPHELWILGEGSQRPALEAYIREHGLESSVKLLGFHVNPYPLLAQGDLFVCSSRSEGFSTAVTEALVLGLPVATTECSGMRELLGENGECGLITDNDDDALHAGLKRLLSDPALLAHYAAQAKVRADAFDLNRTVRAIENEFTGVLACRKGGRS